MEASVVLDKCICQHSLNYTFNVYEIEFFCIQKNVHLEKKQHLLSIVTMKYFTVGIIYIVLVLFISSFKETETKSIDRVEIQDGKLRTVTDRKEVNCYSNRARTKKMCQQCGGDDLNENCKSPRCKGCQLLCTCE